MKKIIFAIIFSVATAFSPMINAAIASDVTISLTDKEKDKDKGKKKKCCKSGDAEECKKEKKDCSKAEKEKCGSKASSEEKKSCCSKK